MALGGRDDAHAACGKIGVRGRKALIARLYFDGYAPLIAAGRLRASGDA